MSITILKLIPADPGFIPDTQAQEEVLHILQSIIAPTSMVHLFVRDNVHFVDQGQNWKHVLCPECGQAIDEWWTHAMDNAQRENFQHLEVQVPCCGKKCSLNDLQYEWPAGFARFGIEVEQPAISLSDQQMQLLQEKLGCVLRVISAHY
jgi:endogenous inhibitor of DNA gyrase (YacG/DUF329 family)